MDQLLGDVQRVGTEYGGGDDACNDCDDNYDSWDGDNGGEVDVAELDDPAPPPPPSGGSNGTHYFCVEVDFYYLWGDDVLEYLGTATYCFTYTDGSGQYET